VGSIRSGKAEGLLYSLSRWTDLPAAKWGWLTRQLQQGWMVGFDPRTAVPSRWSLAPEDTLGLVFWTRDPTNLIANPHLVKAHHLVVHMTLTGWHEVEHGAPGIEKGLDLMRGLVDTFGAENVVWRFSPVPAVKDAVTRFGQIARSVEALGVNKLYVAFLQPNDLMPEGRSVGARQELLRQMAGVTGLTVRVCQADKTLVGFPLHTTPNVGYGVCEDGRHFASPGVRSTEDCGCALAVDPFTVTESCTMGCSYCYSANENISPCKRDTTKPPIR